MPSLKRNSTKRRKLASKRKVTLRRKKNWKPRTHKTHIIKEPTFKYKYVNYPDYTNKGELVDKDFRNSVVHGANFTNINLSGAKLQGAKFVECIFVGTNFDHAHIDAKTEFINCMFKNCKVDNIIYAKDANKAAFLQNIS
jgi:uncharacterized protein YjbI with pentapeptide repeats